MADKLVVGCGYLGRRVAARWVGQGHRVYALTRSEGRAVELRRLGVGPVRGDVLAPDSLAGLPAVGTVLYSVGYDRAAGRPMREVYVDGLRNVLTTLVPPEWFLYVSSTGVYGGVAGEETDEDAPTEPLEESGRVVLDAERLLRGRLPAAVILRFAGIYGPGRVLRRQAVERGELLIGDPEKWLNLIHVEDGAAAVLAADERAAPGRVYNVSDGVPVRRREFYGTLARLLGAPEPQFVLPASGESPPHERANRRILSRRLRDELGAVPRYADYAAGLRDALLAPAAGGSLS